MDSIVYDSVTWHQRPSGHYHNKRRGYLHRYIWQKANGPILPKFVIHHADHNVKNNDLSNLVLMSKSDHQRHHSTGRPATEKQKAAAKLALQQARVPRPEVCIVCSAGFFSTAFGKTTKFCSTSCLERWRSNAFKPEQRACIVCQGSYIAVKPFQRYCCKRCNAKSTTRTYRANPTGGKKRRKISELNNVQPNS